MLYRIFFPVFPWAFNEGKSKSAANTPVRRKSKRARGNFWIRLVMHHTNRDRRIRIFGNDPLI